MKKFIYTIILLVIIGTVNLCIIHKKNDNNSDAKYVEIINEYILNDNGSIDFIHHHKVKLNTYYAIRHLGDDRIIYNPKYQKIEILKSETKMNDGTIVETPENGFNEVLPRCATKAPSYNHLREMVVTHTGLDLGSTIDFTYSLHAEKEFLPALMGEEIFSTFYPVGKMIVKITVPTEKTMNYKMFNSTKKVKIKEDDNTKTYIWKFKNIPAVIHENNQSEIENFSPRLVFSTLESWENLAEYLKIMSDKSMKIDEKLKSNIEKDLSKKDDDLLKIIELQKNINENVGLTNCSPLTYGYKPKSVSKTFNENNGTALDKSLLLVTYLKLSDIDATPIFISKYDEFAKEVPSLFQFDNFLISHKDTTEVIYIIPNHEQTNNYKFNIENKTVFDFNNISKPLTKIEKDNKNQNFQILNLNLNIKDDLTLTGDYELNYSGVFNPYFTLFEDEKNAESNAKKIINGTIENSEIVKMNQKKSVINGEFNSDDTLKIKDGYLRYELPEFSDNFNNRKISVASKVRTTPLDLQNSFCENYKLKIKYQNNFTCINPDTTINIENKIGVVEIEFKNEKNKIIVNKKIFISKKIITPNDYQFFRNLIVIWQNPNFCELVFSENKNEYLANQITKEFKRGECKK